MKVVTQWPEPLLKCRRNYNIPVASFENGVGLPCNLYVQPGQVELKQSSGAQLDELWFVNERILAAPPYKFSASVVGERLYLGADESRWANVKRFWIWYVAVPAELDKADDKITLPDYAKNVLTHRAALFMADRDDDVDSKPFSSDWQDEEQLFMATITSQRRAAHGRVRARR